MENAFSGGLIDSIIILFFVFSTVMQNHNAIKTKYECYELLTLTRSF